MRYELFIADKCWSSWSMRGWLMLHRFGLPYREVAVGLYAGTMAQDLAPVAPARLVPALRTPEGEAVGDSLAMGETLAERHPEAGLWPEDAAARMRARWLVAEMHSGFSALRGDCPMNFARVYDGFRPSDAVLADLDRLELLWSGAKDRFGAQGPWLFGAYSLADVFFAPVAVRIAGYGLPTGPVGTAYVAAHLADPALRRWRAEGLASKGDKDPYRLDLPERPWPGPAPIPAQAIASGPSVNDTCPYSGDPVTHFAEIGGKVYGFCNAYCRDKTVVDPDAFAAFMEIYQS